MRFYFTLLLSFLVAGASAQAVLKPSIGLSALPSDNAAICSIPTFQGDFAKSGFRVGDTIPDFTLYTTSGTPVNMATVLQAKKPVLLVAGSYTCPVFRAKVADLNTMASFYGRLLNIYIVYTVEAHPNTDPSPYSGTIWVTSQNTSSNILFPQPTTYGKRKAMIDTMRAHMSITPQILVDGPCNEWWSNFGPAPNNAYLIDTNGRVRAKNGWYDKLPDNMWCSIDTLLGTNSGKCSSLPANANFSFRLLEDSVSTGPAGSVLTVHGMLKNMSATNGATVNIQKIQKSIPAGWSSALCTDVCLNASIDATQVIIPAADSQSFIFYFYTDATPASGNVTVGFSNPNNTNNKLKQGYYAITGNVGVSSTKTESTDLILYPNPASGDVYLKVDAGNAILSIEIADITGRRLRTVGGIKQQELLLDRQDLLPGVYFIRANCQNGIVTKRLELQ
jgi:hypothetical protein